MPEYGKKVAQCKVFIGITCVCNKLLPADLTLVEQNLVFTGKCITKTCPMYNVVVRGKLSAENLSDMITMIEL
jgi:hypothetical protein